jgi:GNAT superfamily N-acetyltransferase
MILRLANVKDAAGIARMHVASWRTTYRGILPDDYLAGLSCQVHEQKWQEDLANSARGEFTYVVEDDRSEIAGFASGGPERDGDYLYRGELQAIYLLERHQKQGLGRRLVCAVARRLAHDGFETMLVWVLAKNSSRGFYEKLGGALIKSKLVGIGQVELEEVAYGWRTLRPLLELP